MMAAAAAVAVMAAALALYGVLVGPLGGPGAAAAVAGAAAVLAAIIGLGLSAWVFAKPKARKAEPVDDSLMGRLMALAQGRPIVATSALIAGLVMAIRNPAMAAAVAKAFLDPKSRPSNKKA
jgi:hypothetical protein